MSSGMLRRSWHVFSGLRRSWHVFSGMLRRSWHVSSGIMPSMPSFITKTHNENQWCRDDMPQKKPSCILVTKSCDRYCNQGPHVIRSWETIRNIITLTLTGENGTSYIHMIYMQTGFDVHPYNRTGLQKKFDNVLWIGSGSTFICWTKTTKSVLYLGHDLIWNPSSFYHLFSLGFIYSTCMPCIICYLQTDNDLQNDVVWYLPICKRRGIF